MDVRIKISPTKSLEEQGIPLEWEEAFPKM
jgi:hypothetical protein